MKKTRFLKGRPADPTHIGFLHTKSASYRGNLHKLVKRNDSISPLVNLSEEFEEKYEEFEDKIWRNTSIHSVIPSFTNESINK